MLTITTTRGDTTISTWTAATLDAARMDIITDALPATMQLREAVHLLGQITGDGGVITLPDARRITVTRSDANPMPMRAPAGFGIYENEKDPAARKA